MLTALGALKPHASVRRLVAELKITPIA